MPNPVQEVINDWVASGGKVWQLIEPVDSLHPTQVTQKMIAKSKSKKFKNSGVLVKFPKKKQDFRIDLPTVGLNTFKQCKIAGLKGIVLKSNYNVFLERDKCISFANKNNVFIIVK